MPLAIVNLSELEMLADVAANLAGALEVLEAWVEHGDGSALRNLIHDSYSGAELQRSPRSQVVIAEQFAVTASGWRTLIQTQRSNRRADPCRTGAVWTQARRCGTCCRRGEN